MNLYLDIDGVLLTDSLENHGNPTPHSEELLKVATTKHKCFWLTTHCHGGENRTTEYLYPKFPLKVREYLDKISPTNWGSWKTDAIDFSQDFRWLDDDIYQPEYDALTKNSCSEKLITVNLRENPNQLKDIILLLETMR